METNFIETQQAKDSHAFRHGFAVNAVLSGVPPLVLRRWLGHAKMDSTLVYTEALAQGTRQYLERMEF